MGSGDDMITLLRRWGIAQVYRFISPADPVKDPRAHVIERCRRFAPMTRKRAEKKLVDRDGSSRRQIMARAAGVKTMAAVPKWACDPIPCSESRKRTRFESVRDALRSTAAVQSDTPSELQWIDHALADMARDAPIRAMVLREEFTGQGTQKEKAFRVRQIYGGALSVWQYRRELEKGIAWLQGRRRWD